MSNRWLVILVIGLASASQEKTEQEGPKKEPIKLILPLCESLKEEQVQKLEEPIKSLTSAEIQNAKIGIKELTVLIKGATQLSELEALLKKAEVKISKDDIGLNGKVTLLIKATYENQP
jgi:translation initiation factor IF-2